MLTDAWETCEDLDRQPMGGIIVVLSDRNLSMPNKPEMHSYFRNRPRMHLAEEAIGQGLHLLLQTASPSAAAAAERNEVAGASLAPWPHQVV